VWCRCSLGGRGAGPCAPPVSAPGSARHVREGDHSVVQRDCWIEDEVHDGADEALRQWGGGLSPPPGRRVAHVQRAPPVLEEE
jgi:hypothetical protein